MKKIKLYIYLTVGLIFFTGCSEYLDVVPDDIATLDHAFKNRVAAEKFLFTCYAYMPEHSEPELSPGFLTGDGMITVYENPLTPQYTTFVASRIGLGQQNINAPYLNYWDGLNGSRSLFDAIRNCNIFIEEIHNARDMDLDEIAKWTAEVKFLKAYYHFYLMRLYGPVPLIKENLGLNTPAEEVDVFREPISEVVDYICELIDEAVPNLPEEIQFPTEEAGRITKPIALAIKAQARLWDASPLFNGNTDYSSFIDKRGTQLISQQYSEEKWVLVKDAAKEAIDAALLVGHELFYSDKVGDVSDSTLVKLNVRGAFSESWNREVIWGDTQNNRNLQNRSQPRFTHAQDGGFNNYMNHAGTLRMAELFYSNNGIPIEEDPAYFQGNEWYDLNTAGSEDRFYIAQNYETAKLHFNREPRFYANLGFDGSTWFGNGQRTDENLAVVRGKRTQAAGDTGRPSNLNATGYYPKKYLSYETVITNDSWTPNRYALPIIRLADLYLIYAEALNESQGPSSEVFQYLDEIRTRAGLNGVEASWAISTDPSKPSSKEGLREIIRQERLIEMAFEGSRFYDLRRWKLAEEYLNIPMKGWNYSGKTSEEYYQVTTHRSREFTKRDYLWPIKLSSMIVNSNLIQNPGWE